MIETLLVLGAALMGGVGVGRHRSPGARARRKARRALASFDAELEQNGILLESAREDLAVRLDAYARHDLAERQRAAPMEALKEHGATKVRWSALHDAGYRTAGDLRDLDLATLEAVDGIGDKSAQRIRDAQSGLAEALARDPLSPPDAELRDEAARALAEKAYRYLKTREELAPIDGRLRMKRADLLPVIESIERDAGFWKWAARSLDEKRKRELLEQAERLEREVEALDRDELAAARRRALDVVAERLSREHLVADYRRRFADYVSLFERQMAERDARGRTHAVPAGAHGLPEEIARAVEAFPLRVDALRVSLRTYQQFGVKYILHQERTVLGDDMGLGKTVQALAAMVHLREAEGARRFLVVSPASILHNWAREIRTRTPLDAFVVHGSERADALRDWLQAGGVAVTSFGTLRAQDVDAFFEALRVPIDLLVVDEAHYVKNPDAARTQAVSRAVESSARVCLMTGTPLENRIEEFQNLVFLTRSRVDGLPSREDSSREQVDDPFAFQRAVAPVYLRRNQRDVLHELPERIEKEEWLELAPGDRAAYREAVLERNIMAMRQAATIGDGERTSAKLERLDELIGEYREVGAKVLIFSYFLGVLETLARRYDSIGPITGSLSPEERMQHVDEFQARDGHAVLLSQIQAGGVGLNIQAASAVVLMEPQFKPSSEEQAIARAHRMGQTQVVLVHRLLARDSVDERILEILGEKRRLFDEFARDSLVKQASPQATETSLVKAVVDAEYRRLADPRPSELSEAEPH